MAEQRIVVEGHLGIERQQTAVLGGDQRVDLDHGGIEIAEGAVGAHESGHRLADHRRRKTQGKGDLAGLELLHADRGLDGTADHGVGLGLGDLLDLHAAGTGGNQRHALLGTIQHKSQIQLTVDVAGAFDIEAVHDLAGRAGLVRHQALAEQLVGRFPDLVVGTAQLDAAGLAAGAGMDLRLDHPLVAADFLGAVGGLFGTVGQSAWQHVDAKPCQNLFRLILMDFHDGFS